MFPLTVTQILTALFNALTIWAQPIKGAVSIARDPFNVLEILAGSPQGFRLITHWAGDESVSDIDQLPLVAHTLEVIFSYNLGLTLNPSMALIQGTATRPPLYDLIDHLRAFVLGVQYPTGETATYAVYQGCRPFVTPEGVPLAAYVLTFKLTAAVNVNPPLPIP